MSTKTESPILTLSDVDDNAVQIDRAHLREAGWIPEGDAAKHCGHDIDETYSEGVQAGRDERDEEILPGQMRVMEQWHNEHHESVFRFCYEAPCLDLRRAGDAYP